MGELLSLVSIDGQDSITCLETLHLCWGPWGHLQIIQMSTNRNSTRANGSIVLETSGYQNSVCDRRIESDMLITLHLITRQQFFNIFFLKCFHRYYVCSDVTDVYIDVTCILTLRVY